MGNLHLEYHGKIFSKKNSKQIVVNKRTGKPTIISNKNVRDMESKMVESFKVQMLEQGWTERLKEETTKYLISVNIYEESNIRHDLDNQLTSILDALTASLTIPDDCVKYVTHLEINYCGVDREDPRAEIEIWEED